MIHLAQRGEIALRQTDAKVGIGYGSVVERLFAGGDCAVAGYASRLPIDTNVRGRAARAASSM